MPGQKVGQPCWTEARGDQAGIQVTIRDAATASR